MKNLERLAYILVLLAAALYLVQPFVAACLMAGGGLGIMVCHLSEKYGANVPLRQRRARKLRHMLGLCYLVTAYFMWRHDMQWVAFLLVAVVIEIYTLFISNKE